MPGGCARHAVAVIRVEALQESLVSGLNEPGSRPKMRKSWSDQVTVFAAMSHSQPPCRADRP